MHGGVLIYSFVNRWLRKLVCIANYLTLQNKEPTVFIQLIKLLSKMSFGLSPVVFRQEGRGLSAGLLAGHDTLSMCCKSRLKCTSSVPSVCIAIKMLSNRIITTAMNHTDHSKRCRTSSTLRSIHHFVLQRGAMVPCPLRQAFGKAYQCRHTRCACR